MGNRRCAFLYVNCQGSAGSLLTAAGTAPSPAAVSHLHGQQAISKLSPVRAGG